jgi:hypothetical protein
MTALRCARTDVLADVLALQKRAVKLQTRRSQARSDVLAGFHCLRDTTRVLAMCSQIQTRRSKHVLAMCSQIYQLIGKTTAPSPTPSGGVWGRRRAPAPTYLATAKKTRQTTDPTACRSARPTKPPQGHELATWGVTPSPRGSAEHRAQSPSASVRDPRLGWDPRTRNGDGMSEADRLFRRLAARGYFEISTTTMPRPIPTPPGETGSWTVAVPAVVVTFAPHGQGGRRGFNPFCTSSFVRSTLTQALLAAVEATAPRWESIDSAVDRLIEKRGEAS